MHGMGPVVDPEDLHHWSKIGPDQDEAPYFPKGDRRRARKWDSGVPSSLSGASSLVAGDDDGSGPYWYDVVQEGCGHTSPAEIEVGVEGSGARRGDDYEDDDPWSKRERGQLYLQRHLEATLRSIPELDKSPANQPSRANRLHQNSQPSQANRPNLFHQLSQPSLLRLNSPLLENLPYPIGQRTY
ncbi:UNVERIFIED_CONTAM: hypothetical protein K2H54_006323 [Gekko kuhli]